MSFGGALLTWSTSTIQHLTAKWIQKWKINSISVISDLFIVNSEISRNFEIPLEYFRTFDVLVRRLID